MEEGHPPSFSSCLWPQYVTPGGWNQDGSNEKGLRSLPRLPPSLCVSVLPCYSFPAAFSADDQSIDKTY